jgi:hypothetical protein
MRAPMTNAELQQIRTSLAAMEALLGESSGAPSEERLLEFRSMCWSVLLLANDAECQEHLDLLVQYAKELFCGGEAGAEGRIRTVLGSFRARLTHLEHGYGKRWRDLRAA